MSTTASTHGHSGTTDATAAENSIGLVSLNPADGLFLRAEHLSTIQDYARALTMAVGQGAGTGVVWGLDLRLDDEARQLVAAPGLAITGLGRPLLSRVSSRAELPTEAAGQDQATGYWVVRACYDDELTGRENRYGNLCDDECGCDGGSTIRPFRHEGLRLDLLPQSEAGLGEQDPERRRGWLASWYFEQERRLADPWLTRGTESQLVGSRLDREWYRGGPEPTTACVPLGVLLQVRDGFVLDTWTARRDIGQGHADDVWRWRLGMRPWNVFMAQILQFQDQLTEFTADLAQPVVAQEVVVDQSDKLIQEYLREQAQRDDVRWLAQQLQAIKQPYIKVSATTSLYEKGFMELPPAGFLPAPPSRAALDRELEALFDDRVSWRVCSTSADAVARAVDHAQHLDRIPLIEAWNRPEVDILVPDRAPDLPALATSYGWVAFVRRRGIACEVQVDEVDVYTLDLLADDDAREALAYARSGHRVGLADWLRERGLELEVELEQIGTLTYPQDTWEFPGGDVARNLGDDDLRVLGILALPREEGRGPLMALRAQLFAASFERQPVHVVVAAEDTNLLPREAIVLVLGARGEQVTEEEPGEPVVVLVEAPSVPPAPAAEGAAVTESAATKRTASKATALKATARKAPAAKTAATKATATKATTTKATTTKATAKKATAKKAATKKATAKKATRKQPTRKRTTGTGSGQA